MKLRATTILSYGSPKTVACRLELQWEEGSSWLDLGLEHRGEEEWMMLLSLLVLGARTAGVSFEVVDLRDKVLQ